MPVIHANCIRHRIVVRTRWMVFMFGYRNKMLAASSLSPAAVTGDSWRLAEPAQPARSPSRDFPLLRMSATIVCLLGLPVMAHAGYTPPALAPGDTYQLVFVTADPTQATTGNIAVYDNFVNTEAAADASLPATTWSALASTA